MKLMIDKITITRKYEQYYHNAKNMKNWKYIKKQKIWVGEWRLGKTSRYPNRNTIENRTIADPDPLPFLLQTLSQHGKQKRYILGWKTQSPQPKFL